MFRTYEPTRDRLVAVKVFRLDIVPEQAQALADELAQAAEAGLFHPSIVEPIAAGVEGTTAYRAEEYVAAESLDVAMRHYAPAPLETVTAMIDQLAGAIDAARAAGIGHGALHPRDVFVTPDESRACGFGVVEALERVGIRAPVRRPYTAPERVAGEAWSTPADVFSLAAIAFELLTGRRPSGTGDQIGGLNGAVAGDHDRLLQVLARAMDASPEQRFGTARAFADALAGRTSIEAAIPAAAAAAALAPNDDLPVGVQPDESPAFADEDDPVFAAAGAGAARRELDFEPEPDQVSEDDLSARAVERDAEEVVEDDIAAERDEDEAEYVLSREEAEAEARQESVEEVAGFDDVAVEAAADELAFDAADLALTDPETVAPQFAGALAMRDEAPQAFEEEPQAREEVPQAHEEELQAIEEEPDPGPVRPVTRGRLFDDADVEQTTKAARHTEEEPLEFVETTPSRVLDAGPPRFSMRDRTETPIDLEERAPFEAMANTHERSRIALLPMAMILIPGLLIAFGAGYMVGGRRADAPDVAGVATPSATASTDGTPGQPAGTLGATREIPPRPSDTAEPPRPAPTPAPARNPDRPVPALPRNGDLAVRSNPAGASVSINGRWRGRTPLQLKDLAFGNYNVRVVMPGYVVPTEAVNLTAADASRSLSFQLQRQPAPQATPTQQGKPAQQGRSSATATQEPRTPAPAPATGPGSIDVDSRPVGAQVMLDGKPVGVTPLSIPDVAPGTHVVQLELTGHQVWSERTEVTAGRKTRVAGSLEPIR